MIASLPMYDRAETRAANDRFWALIRDHLFFDKRPAPEHLTRDGDVWQHWLSPDLFLSQTCGLPYRARLHGKVTLVGTPVFDLPCKPGYYFSTIIARKDDSRTDFSAFNGATFAYNEPLSQSGWAAPKAMADAYEIEFGAFHQSGAHVASARAVAEGHADIAAIDAVTWKMIKRYDDFAANLKEIAATPPTPALPYISQAGVDIDDLWNAMSIAIDNLSAADRDALCLTGMTVLHPEKYLAVEIPQPPGE